MIDTIKKLNLLLGKDEKKKTFRLFLISVAGAFLDMIGVSLMVPMMSAILDPEVVTKNQLIESVCHKLSVEGHREFIILCIVLMIAVFIFKDLFILFGNIYKANFVFRNRFRMQQKMLNAFLQKPYAYYLNAESGEILRIIRTDVLNSYALLNMLLSLASESIVSFAIILVVLIIDPLMTLLIAGFLFIIMLVIIKVIKPILRTEGERYRSNVSKTYKWLIQSIQGIKEIRVNGRERFFEENFEEAGSAQVASEKRYAVWNGIPRIIIEIGCVLAGLIALLIMILSGSEPKALVPAFSAFAMAAVKLMPAFNRIINTVGGISFHSPSIDRLLENLQNVPGESVSENAGGRRITFCDKIEFQNVTFRYDEGSEAILENASMTIPAGMAVGISGVSGAGKTTTVDVLLGLLTPEKGEILCDGIDVSGNYREWLSHIAYLPQSIFMMDGTIRENVVFGGVSDDAKVWAALEEAELSDFVRRLPEGLDTKIGERGVRLSGGERQRVGIARALYTDPELIVFDEATSALDVETEAAVLEAVRTLHGKKTIIIIAHRPETIQNCDLIYEVRDKGIRRHESKGEC